MATAPNQLAKTGKFGDLRRRLTFLLLALVVYRIGAHIPVPGINPQQLQSLFQGQQGGILNLFNMFSGGALSRFTVFALGIMPYISASIIMQLMSYVVPSLEALKKEGESGRRKITQYTRYGTLVLGIFQSLGIALALEGSQGLVLDPGFGFRVTTVVSLVAGTMFLMWLGEQITERGLGNGISILIFGGIAAGLPNAIGGLFELVRTGAMSVIACLFIIAIVILVTFAVVFVERGQRKILVNYAKRQVGNKVYGGQSSHLPLKLNMSGVIPPIFASSIILLPATVVGWFATGDNMRWLKDISGALSPGQPIYVLLYAAMIVFFSFFYTALVFNSRETADNLKKSGAFIPGIRPGDQTAKHIDKILSRLTFAGAIYITLVCLLPEFLVLKYNVPFYFGGTSLLIIVVVTMDFWAQVQSYVMSQQYESLLKKANFKAS
ncbi:preprotein translocase subunit SecY [Ideonella dechloratans]|uniref:Protein translocase subunit SecY n=1 Tax=Ideonella dechloratans TaxID=36863 RepID=A0A643FD16_IDEDE|nr:preprotein translocase subunit SecY [Ideonella dechloratans]KAB0583421.1 preprotein translocase subunit SecY [Ideonella dechloratans]UFU09667.1 preprotein translocase subunit SecY [Ideonella dechloratans]